MRILYKEPNKDAEIREITGELEEMQELVGGYIQTVPIMNGIPLLIICNEEGKLQDLEPNLVSTTDVIVGNIFIIASEPPEFRGLTDKELAIAQAVCNKLDIRNFDE